MSTGVPPDVVACALREPWDVDASTPAADLWASPLGVFVDAFKGKCQSALGMRLLALFAARRALACWRLYCDDPVPLDGVSAAENCVMGGASDEILRFREPAKPSFRGTPIVDCRECDTSCAATAVAYMARVIATGDARELAICLSSADGAFDQSPLGSRDQFRRWLFEVAAPAALESRELTAEEKSRFQTYSLSELDCERASADDFGESAAPHRKGRWWPFW